MFEDFSPARWERLMGWAERSQPLQRREELLRCAFYEALKPGGREYIPTTLVYFGQAYLEERQLARARAAFEQALGALYKAEGRNSSSVPGYLTYVAEAAEQAGDIAAARETYREAIALLENAPPGPTHVACMANLGHLLRDEHPEEAEALYRRAAEISAQVHGPDHEETATATRSLALHLAKQRRFPEAIELMERAIHLYTSSRCHPIAAVASRELASILSRAGRFDEAERTLRRSKELFDLARRQRNEGGQELLDAVQDATWIECEADLLRDRGQYPEAEALYQEAMGIFTRLGGKDTPALISALEGYAELLRRMGRYEAAAIQELEADRLRDEAQAQRCPGCGRESHRSADACEHCKRAFGDDAPIEPATADMMAMAGFPEPGGMVIHGEDWRPRKPRNVGAYIVYGLFLGILGSIGYLVWYAYAALEWDKFKGLMMFLMLSISSSLAVGYFLFGKR